MTAQPIHWHEECLQNQIQYLVKLRAYIASEEVKAAKLAYDIDIATRQLMKAKRLGKTSFDSERFLPDPPSADPLLLYATDTDANLRA